jgi:hypothetical protein
MSSSRSRDNPTGQVRQPSGVKSSTGGFGSFWYFFNSQTKDANYQRVAPRNFPKTASGGQVAPAISHKVLSGISETFSGLVSHAPGQNHFV